jgi:hypothetical protein
VIHEIAASTQIIDMPLWVGLTARTISYATITIISTVERLDYRLITSMKVSEADERHHRQFADQGDRQETRHRTTCPPICATDPLVSIGSTIHQCGQQYGVSGVGALDVSWIASRHLLATFNGCMQVCTV